MIAGNFHAGESRNTAASNAACWAAKNDSTELIASKPAARTRHPLSLVGMALIELLQLPHEVF